MLCIKFEPFEAVQAFLSKNKSNSNTAKLKKTGAKMILRQLKPTKVRFAHRAHRTFVGFSFNGAVPRR